MIVDTYLRPDRRFTLIELLVVVAIIAILASLLLPALSQARARSQSVLCLSNVKGINLAVSLYAGDQDGFAVPYGWRSESGGGPAAPAHWKAAGFASWQTPRFYHQDFLGQYTEVDTTLKPWGTFTQGRGIWNCPSDTRFTVDYALPYRVSGLGSGNFFGNVYNPTAGWDRLRKLDRCVDASKVMTIIDGNKFEYNLYHSSAPFYGNPDNVDHLYAWDKDKPMTQLNHRMRHAGNQASMGFIDGHAELIQHQPNGPYYWLKPLYGKTFVISPANL